MRLVTRRLLGVMVLACAAAACDTEPLLPFIPTASEPVTETFSGQVTRNDAKTHSFTVSRAGSVTATLRTIGSNNSLVVGMSLGTWNTATSSCSIVLANDAATGGAVLTGTMTAAGSLCLRIYDVGNIAPGVNAAYSVEVTHP